MADATLARREARRRRILENSSSRLQLISNITNNECCKETPGNSVKTAITEQNNEIPARKIINTPTGDVNNGMINNTPISCEPLADNNLEHVFFGEQEISNDLAALAFPEPEPSETTFFEKFITYRYDIVVLSLFIQLLQIFSIMLLDNTYTFLPLAIYMTTKFMFFTKQESSKYANILMLLNGITSQQSVKIMSAMHYVSTAVQDVCIYLFTTISIQTLFITINDFVS